MAIGRPTVDSRYDEYTGTTLAAQKEPVP